MLKNKLTTTRVKNGKFFYRLQFMILTATLLLYIADSQLKLGVSITLYKLLISIIILFFVISIIIWLIRNKLYKGFKYSMLHYFTILKLRKAFLDSNYYNKRIYFNTEIAELPDVKLIFNKDLSKAKLFVQNINIKKAIDDVNISFALGNFVVDRAYLSNDENYHVFEIYESNINQQYKFHDFKTLRTLTSKLDNYTLQIDKSTKIPLHGTLLVGQTGSGKTYALYSLILQMISKKVNYNLYFADPKNSSLAVLGAKISKDNTTTDINEIINSLQIFVEKMNERKFEIKEKLTTKLEADYTDFKYEPHIFIFDEFASFQSVIQTLEKKRRDEVTKLLSQIVLLGRQLGFFLWIVMQKSDASLLPTNLRENLPIKFVLGNAEKQTYVTAFGTGVDIPDKNFELGQGLFTCPIIADSPKICHFSYLNFDILKAVKQYNESGGL